jgi:dynactin complex subunit
MIAYHSHRGVVAFVGEVHYAKGVYAGVVMDDRNVGKNNGELVFWFLVVSLHLFCAGTIKGIEYFRCGSTEKALMVPINEVVLIGGKR